jgi:hypothetical protein
MSVPPPPHAQVHALQLAVLHEINELNNPRLGIMEMEVDVRSASFALAPSFFKQDICSLIHTHKSSKALIYFHPKYTLDDDGRKSLYVDLRKAAIHGGDMISQWGKGTGKHQIMYIRCQCAVIYRGKKVNKETGLIVDRSDYRNASYSNDRRNQRPGQKGRNASHRTSIDRRLNKSEGACSFSLAVFQDDTGYYIKTKNSFGSHQYHARRDHLRTSVSLLEQQDLQVVADLNTARAKLGTSVNLHYARSARVGTPTVLSRHQVAYLCKKKKGKDGNKNAGDTDDIFSFLEQSGNYYVSLLARGSPKSDGDKAVSQSKSTLFNESRIGNVTSQEDVALAGAEDNEMRRIVDGHRKELAIEESKEMMVGVAYGMPFELDQFSLFHVALHIDATADTNIEGRPLVTVTSKDSYGHMFFVLRAFLPSEQAWAYKWLFQTVFPVLIGKEVLKKISIIVTDGDSQEITQLEDAVNKYCPDVRRLRCSWHIIDRGWHKKVNVPLGGHSRRKRPLHLKGKKRRAAAPLTVLNKTARTIYRWLFSWAQPSYCENEDEYKVSKALFLKFVQSKQVRDLFDQSFVDSVIMFVRENVFPHEARFCYYHRHGLFHLEIHTNCGQEGTNNGVKHNSAPVMPQNKLEHAIVTLDFNATVKAQNTSIMLCQKTNARKLWADTPTSGHVTDVCESMLQTEWKRSEDWIVHRDSQHRWFVIHRLENDKSNKNGWSDDESESDESETEETEKNLTRSRDGSPNTFGPIPRFSRVYKVQVRPYNNVFGCTCKHQERMGMPCRHIAAVCRGNSSILGKDPKGFPLSSIRIFWWNQYYYYGMSQKKDHQKSREALIALAKNDTEGLPCPGRLNDPTPYTCPEYVYEAFYMPASDRLLNYNSYDAIAALQSMQDRNNPRELVESVPAGLSQHSCLPVQDDLDSNDDNWFYEMEELSDTEDYGHSRKVLSRHFNELSEAFNNSKEKESLEVEFQKIMNDFIIKARGSAAIPSSSQGQRVSMLPPSSKKRKTHGTNY